MKRPTTRAEDLTDAKVYRRLDFVIRDKADGVTPCREDNRFTASLQPAKVSLEAITVCRSCPILAECATAAGLLSRPARANSVMGGNRYNPHGTRISPVLLQRVVDHELWQHEIDQLGAPRDDRADDELDVDLDEVNHVEADADAEVAA